VVLTVGDLDGNIEGSGVGLEIRLLGSTIGVDEVDELGREVGAGEGLPFMYDGAMLEIPLAHSMATQTVLG
jgi:hypothetical protein